MDFANLLPWGLLENRPYLRCLHGYGLYLWRTGNLAAAGEVFRRMLWLNPGDNQGARFNLGAVEAGIPWQDAGAEEVLQAIGSFCTATATGEARTSRPADPPTRAL